MIRKLAVATCSPLFVVAAHASCNFESASSEKYDLASAIWSTTPGSVCAWVKPDDTAANKIVVSLHNSVEGNDYFILYLEADEQVVAATRDAAISQESSTTTTAASATAWQMVCNTSASATDRQAHIDDENAAANTTSRTPGSTPDRTFIGARAAGDFFDGLIAVVAFANADLSEACIDQMGGSGSGDGSFVFPTDSMCSSDFVSLYDARVSCPATTWTDDIGTNDLTANNAANFVADNPTFTTPGGGGPPFSGPSAGPFRGPF